jgi:hypothetical protein
MLSGNLTKDIAKIRRQGEVATFVKLIIPQSGPLTIDLSSAHSVA